jgi:hypothetical protein
MNKSDTVVKSMKDKIHFQLKMSMQMYHNGNLYPNVIFS